MKRVEIKNPYKKISSTFMDKLDGESNEWTILPEN